MRRIVALSSALSFALPSWAGQTNGTFFLASVPTLDEVGLAALIATVAGVAGWAMRRRGRRHGG